MRIIRPLTATPLMLGLPAAASAHQGEYSPVAHLAAHAVWLLPILLIGIASLLIRRRG